MTFIEKTAYPVFTDEILELFWEEQILVAFNEVVNHTSNESRDRILGEKVRALVEQNGGSEQLTEQYQIVSALHGNNHLPLLWKKHRMHRSPIYSLLELLDIRSTTQDDDLLQAFNFIKEY